MLFVFFFSGILFNFLRFGLLSFSLGICMVYFLCFYIIFLQVLRQVRLVLLVLYFQLLLVLQLVKFRVSVWNFDFMRIQFWCLTFSKPRIVETGALILCFSLFWCGNESDFESGFKFWLCGDLILVLSFSKFRIVEIDRLISCFQLMLGSNC